MKLLTTSALLLLSATAVAQDTRPLILGHIPTEGGKAVFTSTADGCEPGTTLLAWIVTANGELTTYGCYRPVGDDLIVIWKDDNSVYSYDFDRLVISTEFKAYMDRKKK